MHKHINYAQTHAAFVFDYRNWGDSGGLPRYVVVNEMQVEDYLSAIAFVKTRPEIDGRRCRRRVEQRFSIATMVSAYEQIYATLFERETKRQP